MMELDKYNSVMKKMQKQAIRRATPIHRRKHAAFLLHCNGCDFCHAHLEAKMRANEAEVRRKAMANMPDPNEVAMNLLRSLGCKV